MSRKSLFRDRVRHDLDLVITGRGAHGIAHYSFKADKFTLRAGSKLADIPTMSMYTHGYDSTLKHYDYLIEKGLLENNILKADLTFDTLGSMGTLVRLAPTYTDGVKLADTNIAFKNVLNDPSLYNKYIANFEYYDKDWNIVCCDEQDEAQDKNTSHREDRIDLSIDCRTDEQNYTSSIEFGEYRMNNNSIFFRRARHDIRLRLLARGADGEVVYNHTEKKFILKKGSKFASSPSKVFCNGRYNRYLEARKSMESSGDIVDNISQRDLIFSGLFSLNSIISLTPAYEDGAYLSGTNINIIDILNDPSLYNKYIAHCEYYDKDWNVIGNTATQEQSDVYTEGEIGEVPINMEDSLEEMEETELESFSTIEIINELLVRLSKIGR